MDNNALKTEREAFDMTDHGVMAYFAETTGNAAMLNYLLLMNRADTWVIDQGQNDLSNMLDIQHLNKKLGSVITENTDVLHETFDEIIDILAYLSSARCLYITQYVDRHNPFLMDKLLACYTEDGSMSETVSVIWRRLEAFLRAKILSQVFSQTRMTRINTIMRSVSDV